MPPCVAKVLQSIVAASQDVVEVGLAAFTAHLAELADWLLHVPADVAQVGGHDGVVGGVEDKGDDAASWA